MNIHLRQLDFFATVIAYVITGTWASLAAAEIRWVQATDQEHVRREGAWQETSFRYADRDHLQTDTDGSSLTFPFDGTELVIRLGQHAVPAYGPPNLGELAVSVDDGPARVIHPIVQPRELVLARNLAPGKHTVRITYHTPGRGAGARIEALGYSAEPTGELAFSLTGEHAAYLVDARAILTRGDDVIANRLVRNWTNGQCQLVGLPPGEGYRLKLQALGWSSGVAEGIVIEPGQETVLPPIYLNADPATVARSFVFPRIGRQVIRRSGENFRARVQAYSGQIVGARIERRVGPATLSRVLSFDEDDAAAFYYHREIVAVPPQDTPPGLYDLTVKVRWPEQGIERELRSPSAVMIVDDYPADPVFVSWGHLDTQGQYQAEYLRNLASIANLVGADMVLMANACNPAYIAGAMSALQIPYTVNFGNHQFPGFQQWFGPQESVIDFGPNLCVLNRSLPWQESTAQADALLTERTDSDIKVINAFEHNVPIDLLDRHRIALVHDGHGPGKRVMEMGATPTLRVGKSSSESFRVIRFAGGQVASCTYLGDDTAPIPFPRGSLAPLRLAVDPPADGVHSEVTLTVINDLREAFPSCRMTTVMPAGEYTCEGGRIETATASDCGRLMVLTLRADVDAESQRTVTLVKEGRR